MTERSEMLLRNQLLSLNMGSLEAAIPDLLELRFVREGEGLSSETEARHLDALHARLNARSTGSLGRWVVGSFSSDRRRTLLWPALAVGIAALLLVLVLTRLRTRNEVIVRHDKAAPENRTKLPPQPPFEKKPPTVEKYVNEPPVGEKKPLREDEIIIPTPNPAPEREYVEHPNPPKPPLVMAKRIPIGTFGNVQGEPTYWLPGEPKDTKVLQNQALFANATIKTGDMDKAEIKLSDGTTIAMDFNTTLVLPPASAVVGRPATLRGDLEVTSGKIFVHVGILPGAEQFSVTTPVARAQCSRTAGSRFSIAVQRDKELTAVLQVQEGAVKLSNQHGSVLAGEKTESRATGAAAPTKPRRVAILGTSMVWTNRSKMLLTVFSQKLSAVGAMTNYAYPYGYAGIGVREAADKRIHVDSVAQGQPADLAGLKVGDILVAADGSSLGSRNDLVLKFCERPGKRIALTVERDGRRLEAPVVTAADYNTIQYPPQMPMGIANQLRSASWLAIVGKIDEAMKRLSDLASKYPSAAAYNNIGVIHEIHDRMEEAIRSYQAAVRLDPRNWKYHKHLGHALEYIGNLDRASEEMQVADALEPRCGAFLDLVAEAGYQRMPRRMMELLKSGSERWKTDPEYWHLTAEALMRLRKVADALEASKKAVTLDPYNSSRHNYLGHYFRTVNRLQEAESEFRKAIDLDPQDSAPHSNLAGVLAQTGRLPEAEAEHRKAILAEPDLRLNHISYGSLLKKMGRLREAEAEYRKGLDLNPSHPLDPNLSSEYVRFVTEILIPQNRVDEAESITLRVMAADRTYPALNDCLAFLIARCEPHKADEIYRKAVAGVWDYPMGLNNLAYCLSGQRVKLDGALTIAERAAKMIPDSGDIADTLGMVHFTRGEFAQAESNYKKAIELFEQEKYPDAGTPAEVYVHLAQVYEKMGQQDKCDDAYRKAIAGNPEDAGMLNNLAYRLAERGTSLDEALELASRAVKITSGDPGILDTLGWVHYKRGEYAQAETVLKNAIERMGKSPNAAKSWLHLGAVCEKMSRIEKAKDAYRKALTLQPKHKDATEALKRLGG